MKNNQYTVWIVAMGLFLSFLLGGCSFGGNNGEQAKEQIEGLWIYDSMTSYQFDSDMTGAMFVEEDEYAFSYEIKGENLKIDFEEEALYDCTYTFKVDGNTLTIEGKEGTTGGTYNLVKKDI